MIKEYFANYYLHNSDVTFDLKGNLLEIHGNRSEPWKVTLVDTGVETMTGGRLKRVREHIGDNTFMMTYGDGLSNVNIEKLLEQHKQSGLLATLTAVRPSGRFGVLSITEQNQVTSFKEKPEGDNSWINGGFFVLEPAVFDCIMGDATSFEREPLDRLSREGQLGAYLHDGFWMAMDKLSDKIELEKMWESGEPKWRTW